jgi:hypothetical protein
VECARASGLLVLPSPMRLTATIREARRSI